jgi:hypothetical protein
LGEVPGLGRPASSARLRSPKVGDRSDYRSQAFAITGSGVRDARFRCSPCSGFGVRHGPKSAVNDPAGQYDRLCAFLDRECGVDGDNTERVRRMTQTVDPALRRNRSDRLFDTADEATPTQRALLRHLLQRVQDSALPFSAADYPLPPGQGVPGEC